MPSRPTVVKDAGDAAKPTDEFDTRELEIAGVTYKLRELSSKEYDKCVGLATDADGLDTVKLLRWMLLKSVVEPADFTAEKLGELSFKSVRRLSNAVNDIHFPQDENSLGNL